MLTRGDTGGKMTFEDIIKIIRDDSVTDYQKAANLHALLTANGHAAVEKKPRKKREARVRAEPGALPLDGH